MAVEDEQHFLLDCPLLRIGQHKHRVFRLHSTIHYMTNYNFSSVDEAVIFLMRQFKLAYMKGHLLLE